MTVQLARGDIVLTRFPFTDLTGHSVRPALVVSQGSLAEDVVLLGISSVLRQPLADNDVLVDAGHRDFAQTGLKVPSVVRVHKLVTVERSVIIRRLGRLKGELLTEVDKRLRIVLGV